MTLGLEMVDQEHPPKTQDYDYSTDPDVLLMMEFQKGNKAFFENLMRKYYKRVFNFIYRFTSNTDVAEDLSQEVFLRVYKAAKSYSPRAKFQTWLFTIAKNLSLNELQKFNRRVYSLDETMETESGEMKMQIPDTKAPDPLEELQKDETVKLIKQAIGELPENQRMAVLLYRYEDFSYAQIAETLGCSLQAVKSLLNRAKENLKTKLSRLLQD